MFSLSADRVGWEFQQSRRAFLPQSAASFLLCLTSHSREKVEPFEEGFCWHKPWLGFIQKGELVFTQTAFGC